MNVYWQLTKTGQRLVLLVDETGQELEIGGVRETKEGFDAFAKTSGYFPGRARKGIATLDEAKAFVESFKPWELLPGREGLAVESEVRPEGE